MVRIQRPFFPILLLVALGLACLSSLDAEFAEVPTPDRTDEGVFHGTWYYVTRDGDMALWIRSVDGQPELKVRFRAKSTTESFETGWDGNVAYTLAGYPATFGIDLNHRDENTLAGSWQWEVKFSNSGRTENGKFILYRVGDGRHMVLKFSEYERKTWKGEKMSARTGLPAWGFRKASKRIVLWDELPF